MEYTFEDSGVKLNGDFVRYDSPIENIKVSTIEKLNTQVATAWALFLLHKSINHQTEVLKKEINKHEICPINPDGIKKIARTEAEAVVKEQPMKLRNKVIPVIKDILLILSVIVILISFFNK